MNSGMIKTICPGCLKIFSVSEDLDQVKCDRCKYKYELPKLKAKLETS